MKIGYPCINNSIECTPNSTFRLASYSREILFEKISSNLSCLKKILEFNAGKNLLFFRISSDVIPFASHPISSIDWRKEFSNELSELSEFIEENNFRVSMHPDQFVLLNAVEERIVENSVSELLYHASFLDSLKTREEAKIQIHLGGAYGNKEESLKRFKENYFKLPQSIKERLVIENDERIYSLKDCLLVSESTKIPVLFDCFHHECFNNGESTREAMELAFSTWRKKDGLPMVDYSSQEPGARKGSHAKSIDLNHFKKFLSQAKGLNFDLMLEIKDKEKSALKALNEAKKIFSIK